MRYDLLSAWPKLCPAEVMTCCSGQARRLWAAFPRYLAGALSIAVVLYSQNGFADCGGACNPGDNSTICLVNECVCDACTGTNVCDVAVNSGGSLSATCCPP